MSVGDDLPEWHLSLQSKKSVAVTHWNLRRKNADCTKSNLMRPFLLSLVVCLLLSGHLKAGDNWKFHLGYGLGRFGNGMNNLQSEIYRLNYLKSGRLASPGEIPNLGHGFRVGLGYYMKPEDRFYFTFEWTNLHLVVSGKGPSTGGSNTEYSVKARFNNLNLVAMGYRVKPWLGIAVSPVDIGACKILIKDPENPEIGKNYQDFYNVEKGLLSDYTVYGSSVFADWFLHRKLRLRAQWYAAWAPVTLRSKNDITTEFSYRPSNLSLSLSCTL